MGKGAAVGAMTKPVVLFMLLLAAAGTSQGSSRADGLDAPILGIWPAVVSEQALSEERAAAQAAASDDPRPWLVLSRAYGSRAMWHECLAAADRAVLAARDFGEGHTARAACALNLGRDDDALRSAREGVRLSPDSFYAQLILGWSSYRTERIDDAKSAFERAVALDPRQPWGHYSLATACVRDQDLRRAIDELEAASAAEPDAGLGERAHAMLDATRASLERALTPYRQRVDDDPDDPAAHVALGDAFFRLGYFAEALDQYDAAMALLPADKTAYTNEQRTLLAETTFNRGIALRELRRWDESLAVLQEVLMSHSDQSVALYNIGLAYMGKGEPSKAVEPLTKAAELAPAAKAPHLSLADAYEALGDSDRARLERDHAATLP